MKRFLFFFVFWSYACLIFGMEATSEELEISEYERIRVQKKYQRDRYLPLYAEKVREQLAQPGLRTSDPREMTAFFNVIIAFLEAIDSLSFDATEEAKIEHQFEGAFINDSLYVKYAVKNINNALEEGFDTKELEKSIEEAAKVFSKIAKNNHVNDRIQSLIERDRDPHASRWENTVEGYSWNNSFSISEYETLSLYILSLTKLLPVAHERALESLPENLGKNIFYKPNTAFRFLNSIHNLDYRVNRKKPPVLECQYYALPWIKKLQSDINDCCYFFLAKMDGKSDIARLNISEINVVIGCFLAKLYLPSNMHTAALPSLPLVDPQPSHGDIKVKKKKSKKICIVQ